MIISEINYIFAEKFTQTPKKSTLMPQIVTLGNALTDVLTLLSSDQALSELRLPKGGMTLIDTNRYHALYAQIQNLQLETATGGSAANTALCLAHLGDNVAYIGKLNKNDRFGQFFLHTFEQAGVQMHCIPASEGMPSGVCTAFVSPDGERTFATYLGAAADMRAEEISETMVQGSAIVHIEGYLVQNHNLIRHAINIAHDAGARVSLDLASYNIVESEHSFFEEILPQVDIVFANEEEAAAWTHTNAEDSLDVLSSICPLVVVKLGAKGAWALRGTERCFGESQHVSNVVDTTAAGDFFAAGFLHALSHDAPLNECLHAGAYCASRVIQVVGTTLTPQMWNEIRHTLS